MPVLLAIYGEGGHRAEMHRLLAALGEKNPELKVVTFGDGLLAEHSIAHYGVEDVRDKHSRKRSLRRFLNTTAQGLYQLKAIRRRYKVVGCISTGPGLCILPMLILRMSGVKTVFVESVCRFYSRSITGRLMYRIAHRFLVQNEAQLALYPKAQLCGQL